MISKAGKRVGMLGRLRDNLTTHSANVVYISLIRLILEYCYTVWGCCGEGNSQALGPLHMTGLARFPRSGLTSDSFVKFSMCSYERVGWLGSRDLGFFNRDLGKRAENFAI